MTIVDLLARKLRRQPRTYEAVQIRVGITLCRRSPYYMTPGTAAVVARLTRLEAEAFWREWHAREDRRMKKAQEHWLATLATIAGTDPIAMKLRLGPITPVVDRFRVIHSGDSGL